METNYIDRPNTVKVFAKNAMNSQYYPVKFGMNQVAKDIGDIANDNFEFGIESLEGIVQQRDLNSVLKYLSSNLSYLFQQGVAEFSPYQDYPANALVQFDGALWISTREIPASKHEPKKSDCCNPCGSSQASECEVAEEPSKETGWCKLVTHCTYDVDKQTFEASLNALQGSIGSLKGVKSLSITSNPDTGNQELKLVLSDGSAVTIAMDKFGKFEEVTGADGTKSFKFTNPNGSTVSLPAHTASIRFNDSKGNLLGFSHSAREKQGEPTETIGLVLSKELNGTKGFKWNQNSNKWEVNLRDLLGSNSGLSVGNDGIVSIDTQWLQGKLSEAQTDTINQLTSTINSKESQVHTSFPISGNGTRDTPLKLALGDSFQIIDNKLELKPQPPTTVTNVTNQVFKYGFHTFSGQSLSTRGLPKDIDSQEPEQDKNPNVATQDYDFNGYYIASDLQVDVWLQGKDNSAWYIMNDSGINSDGSIKDANTWGKWKKLDNSSQLTNNQLQSIQTQLNGFGSKTTAQEGTINDLKQQIQEMQTKLNATCKVKIKNINSNYTIAEDDNVIICDSATEITITVDPATLSKGRIFTVIQAGDGQITFKGNNGEIKSPFKGGTKTAGKDASVSLLVESTNKVRLMGQTK